MMWLWRDVTVLYPFLLAEWCTHISTDTPSMTSMYMVAGFAGGEHPHAPVAYRSRTVYLGIVKAKLFPSSSPQNQLPFARNTDRFTCHMDTWFWF